MNWGMEDLQSSALPLGYAAAALIDNNVYHKQLSTPRPEIFEQGDGGTGGRGDEETRRRGDFPPSPSLGEGLGVRALAGGRGDRETGNLEDRETKDKGQRTKDKGQRTKDNCQLSIIIRHLLTASWSSGDNHWSYWG